jgi:hypothetical protein
MNPTRAKQDVMRDPDNAELAQLKRDLRFYPADTRHPRSLTRAQVEQFNRDGYIPHLRIFSEAEMKPLRAFVDRVQAQEAAAGNDPNFIRFIHMNYATGWDIMNNPTIVGYVKDLLGENVVGWGAAFFNKPPMSAGKPGSTVAWHQDASYWPLSPSKAVTVWLAIDDVDTENAAMQFIAGSHHHGAATFRESTPEEHNTLTQTIDNPEQYGTKVDNILKEGEASIHADLLLHGSGQNRSARRRCGYALRYTAADVRATHGWMQKGVWVSGRDDSGHWSNLPRPAAD